MSESAPKLKIGLSVINFLGPNLYSKISAVLSEMIANAWDANATEINIWFNLNEDQIVIEDNGIGMSLADIEEKYLFVGYQKRNTPSAFISENRQPMGRKGIGNLAVFAFAKTLEVRSNKKGKKIGCILNWQGIEEAIKAEKEYTTTLIGIEEISVSQGTQIILRDLFQNKLGSLKNIDSLRRDIARRFTILDNTHDFTVKINGKTITNSDRPYLNKIEFLWYFGNQGEKYAADCPNLYNSPIRENPIHLNSQVEFDGINYDTGVWRILKRQCQLFIRYCVLIINYSTLKKPLSEPR